jgi:hypothetical protein
MHKESNTDRMTAFRMRRVELAVDYCARVPGEKPIVLAEKFAAFALNNTPSSELADLAVADEAN